MIKDTITEITRMRAVGFSDSEVQAMLKHAQGDIQEVWNLIDKYTTTRSSFWEFSDNFADRNILAGAPEEGAQFFDYEGYSMYLKKNYIVLEVDRGVMIFKR